MNGILNILKPAGMTSFDTVARVRGLLRQKKAGHAGTLDPMAVGVLPICIGSATKAIEYMMEKDKLYRAELTLGIATDTQDSSGIVLSKSDVNCTDDDIKKMIKSFEGKSKQLPPMYSAIKVNGKKLYEIAREGMTIDRTPREIEIFSTEVIDIKRDEQIKVLFDIHCSKGTYIRTLCADIGEKLGCGGCMSFLLRKRAGVFDLSTAVTLEELKQVSENGMLETYLMRVEKVFESFKELYLDANQEKLLKNGMTLRIGKPGDFEPGLLKVFDSDKQFIALCESFMMEDGLYLKSKKFFQGTGR